VTADMGKAHRAGDIMEGFRSEHASADLQRPLLQQPALEGDTQGFIELPLEGTGRHPEASSQIIDPISRRPRMLRETSQVAPNRTPAPCRTAPGAICNN